MTVRDSALLKGRIAAWLAVTRDAQVSVGLAAGEARARAEELLRVIRSRSTKPDEVSIDDEFKHVLSVAVSRLRSSEGSPEARLKEADAVYKFIDRLPWLEDGFGEKRDLLIECAETGWGAVGLSLAEVERFRASVGYDGPIAHRKIEPSDQPLSPARWILGVAGQPLLVVGRLRSICDSAPALVADEAGRLYESIIESPAHGGLFDAHEFLVGDVASLAGGAFRLLGRFQEAERWFDRADVCFRQTVFEEPSRARVAYGRLALEHSRRRYERVSEALPSLTLRFRKLGMRREELKCRFLEAVNLKDSGQLDKALNHLRDLYDDPLFKREEDLLTLVLVNIADVLSERGRLAEAISCCREALTAATVISRPLSTAHLKGVIAQVLREQGLLAEAVEAYRSAIAELDVAGMSALAGYARVVVAESLIALGRYREAEWEILAALPTIEEQKMVPEGFAAVALLKESVRRRKTDPNALRELREHLQAADRK